MLAVTAFFTANGIIVAVAFTGDAGALVTPPLGMALVAGLALLGRRLQLATAWLWGRSRLARVAPALLAGAWVAALATL